MNKKIILAIIALVAVLGMMVGIWFATRPQAQQGSKTITVTVVHANGESKEFTYHTDAKVLSEVLIAEGLIPPSTDGMYNTVDGETADYSVDGSYWAFLIGEEYAAEGMDDTYIHDGDAFKLVYTQETWFE